MPIAPTVRDQVDRRRAAAGEHQLLAARRVQEALHRAARALVALRGALAQRVRGAAYVGAALRVAAQQLFQHAGGLWHRGRVVEIDQRLPMNELTQRWNLVIRRPEIPTLFV